MHDTPVPDRKPNPTIDDVHLANEEAVSAVPVIKEGNTVGVSPKVSWPTVTGVVVGGVLLLLGYEDIGLAVLLSALGYGGIGVAVKPGTVAASK